MAGKRHYIGVMTHRSSGKPDELAYFDDDDIARIADLYFVPPSQTTNEAVAANAALNEGLTDWVAVAPPQIPSGE